MEVAPLIEQRVGETPGAPAAVRLRYGLALETFLTSRVPLWLTVWGSLLMMAHFRGPTRPDNLFLNGWIRWDANYYLRIAQYGYSNVANYLGQRDTHFWPLFPLLTRLFSFVLPGHDLALAAWLLNHVLLFGALVLFDDLCRSYLDERAARLASWLLVFYPFAFYYSAPYTEACFLFTSLLAFHFGHRKRWLVAALAAACASATRAAGIGTAVALVVLYWEECRYCLRNVRWDALFLLLAPLGAVEYVALLAIQFHDPLAFTSGMSARDWGADVGLSRFVETLRDLLSPFSRWPLGWLRATDSVHVACLVGALLVAWLGRRALRPHLVVFTAVELLVASRLWTNGGRYVAPIFPVFMAGAWLLSAHPARARFVCALSLSFQVLLTLMYANNFWVS